MSKKRKKRSGVKKARKPGANPRRAAVRRKKPARKAKTRKTRTNAARPRRAVRKLARRRKVKAARSRRNPIPAGLIEALTSGAGWAMGEKAVSSLSSHKKRRRRKTRNPQPAAAPHSTQPACEPTHAVAIGSASNPHVLARGPRHAVEAAARLLRAAGKRVMIGHYRKRGR